ncbi:uncharacterized protein LOC120345167 [Styela clava]
MWSSSLSPFMTISNDQRQKGSILSKSEVLLRPQPVIKQERILPPIDRSRSPQRRVENANEIRLKVTSLAVNEVDSSHQQLKQTQISPLGFISNSGDLHGFVNSQSKSHLNTPSPLVTPNIRVRNWSSKSSTPRLWPATTQQESESQFTKTNQAKVLSKSDGAKQLRTVKRKVNKRLAPLHMRRNSIRGRENGVGAYQDQLLIHRGSDVGTGDGFRTLAPATQSSIDFVTSPGIGSTMRLRENRLQFPSTSSAYSDSSGPNEKFIPLRRRKSSNTLVKPEFQLAPVKPPIRRRSSVASVSFPDVLRDVRLIPKSRRGVIAEPRFFRTKRISSRRTSSTSDDVIDEKSRDSSLIRDEMSLFGTESSYSKLPTIGHGLSQAHRRLKVGYLSHQFIREMRQRRRERGPKKSDRATLVDAPIDRFRKIAKSVRLLLRCLNDYRTIATVSETSQMPFSMFSNDITSVRTYPNGLTFDLEEYRANSEKRISPELRRIMTLAPALRTEKELKFALNNLRVLAESFGEFPIRMQEALVRVTWLDEFEAKRVIIRQGQPAENFYFIVTGSALVSKNRIDPRTGELFVETVTILKRGMSFGELAIMRRETRSANVISSSSLALLTVHRDDFVDIFMHRMDGEEPEFISFLRKRPEFALFPLQQIPRNKPQICAFIYFRVGVVICDESTASDVIVIVKSGFCKVLKAMKPVTDTLDKPTSQKFKFESSLITGTKKYDAVNNEDHCRDVTESYNEWMTSHPLSVETLKLMADDDELMKREGRRRPSLIEIEHDTDHVKLAKKLESFGSPPPPQPQQPKDLVYIHVQTLCEGDVFGLAPLLFEPSEGGISMSLVSDGAECILLNKNFYLKNMDAEIREKLVRTIQPYPTEESLQENMKKKYIWEIFKHQTMEDYFTNKRTSFALKRNGFQRYR